MAQLSTKVAILKTPESFRNGYNLFVASGVTTMEPGLLVKQTSGSEVGLANVSVAHGIAFGGRTLKDRPTTRVFSAGEEVVMVWGKGIIELSSDFFTSGTLPSAGSPVNAGSNGLWDATGGSKVVGRCIQQRTVRQPTGGTGSNITVARIAFDIPAIN